MSNKRMGRRRKKRRLILLVISIVLILVGGFISLFYLLKLEFIWALIGLVVYLIGLSLGPIVDKLRTS